MNCISVLPRLGAIAAGILLAATAVAQNKPAARKDTDAPTNAPAIAEQADRLLKEMAAYIGSANEFTFQADVTFDHVLPSGQKLQFSSTEEVVLQRPGRVYVEWSGDLGARQFWYDGKSVTLYDPAMPFYASEAAPPEIDCGGAFYARVENGYKVSPPPIGSTITTLPSGAVDQNIHGTTYFVFGGAYYRPFYSGSGVIYEVVAKPA